jgi:hypothetical protein
VLLALRYIQRVHHDERCVGKVVIERGLWLAGVERKGAGWGGGGGGGLMSSDGAANGTDKGREIRESKPDVVSFLNLNHL